VSRERVSTVRSGVAQLLSRPGERHFQQVRDADLGPDVRRAEQLMGSVFSYRAEMGEWSLWPASVGEIEPAGGGVRRRDGPVRRLPTREPT
jgi:hypothetical protein